MAKDRLIVKNFGPIREVDIEMSKVTVFIGEQASGKSVLAKLAALLSDPMASEKRGELLREFHPLLEEFNIATFQSNDSYASFKNDKFESGFKENRSFKSFNDDNLRKLYQRLIEILGESGDENSSVADSLSTVKEVDKYFEKREQIRSLVTEINTMVPESIYIPTERNLISILSTSLYSLLRNNVALPAFIKNFGSLFEVSRKIVKTTDIPALNLKYSFQNIDLIILEDGRRLSLEFSSSGVQSITPIAVVVNAIPEAGKHLFIVEEPELNLYPTTQKALVEYLVEKCTKGDNRLIITTHSPYILTALNNCIQAQNVIDKHPESAAEVAKIVPPQFHLKYEDVIAYHVSGGMAKPIMDDEIQMIDANELDGVSDDLASVFDKLLDLKYQNQE